MPQTLLGNIQIQVSPTRNQDQAKGMGRDLMQVLNVNTFADAMAALSSRCNGTGIPNFAGLEVGDYLDGLDLSGIAAPPGGLAPAAFNSTYANNRIIIAGFNFYKAIGYNENTKNHIVFMFNEAIATGRMNPTNDNTGGYRESEIFSWINSTFGNALNTRLGNCLYNVYRHIGPDLNITVGYTYRCFLPSEIEVYGQQIAGNDIWSDPSGYNTITPVIQLPVFRSMEMIIKKRNGALIPYFLSSVSRKYTGGFCGVYHQYISSYNASSVIGLAPIFCISSTP